MKESLIKRASQNLALLSDQIGEPSEPMMAQTINQAIVIVLKDLVNVVELLDHELELLMK